jgi:hypothetical protein
MFRHPRYLDIPWQIHWDEKEKEPHHHLLLTLILILVAMFLIGVSVTSGIK